MKPDPTRPNCTSPKRPLPPEEEFPSLRRDYSRPTTAVPIRRPPLIPYGNGIGRRNRYSHFQPVDRIQESKPKDSLISQKLSTTGQTSEPLFPDHSRPVTLNESTDSEKIVQDAETLLEATKNKCKVSQNLNDRVNSSSSGENSQLDSVSDHAKTSGDHQLRRSTRMTGKLEDKVCSPDNGMTTASPPPPISIEDEEKSRELRETIRNRFDTPLSYTFFGHKSIQINTDDAERLIEGEYLNDTLVDFGLKFILDCQRQLNPEAASKTFVFNTFFYSRLTQRAGKSAGDSGKSVSGYESVRNWTSKVDLFTMRYVIVPIHEKAHWYVAVICNLDKLPNIARNSSEHNNETVVEITEDDSNGKSCLPSPEAGGSVVEAGGFHGNEDDSASSSVRQTRETEIKDPISTNRRQINLDDPVILILDSLNLQHNYVFKPLRDYLICEAQDKRHLSITKDDIKSRHGTVPLQHNYCDCGIFLIHYVEKFLNSPDTILPRLLDKDPRRKTAEFEEEQNKLWGITEVRHKRRHMLNLLMKLKSDKEPESKTSPSV